MKIVLTGGTGLIGNALGQELVRRGHDLQVLARRPESARTKLSYPCTLWPWREGDPVPDGAVQGAQAMIHLAGENVAGRRWSSARKQALRDSRLKTAAALSESVRQNPLQVFISASGIGFYGDRGDESLTELSAGGHDFLATLCAEWEQAAQRVPAQRHVQMRLGVVLSPRGGFLSEVVPMFRAFGASRLGSGRQYLSWIHIDDVVQAFVSALEDERFTGAYNLTSPEPVTNADLTEQLRLALHAWPAPPAPALALKLLFGELSGALLGSQRATPERLLVEGFRFRYPRLKEALKAIYPQMQAGDMQSVFEMWVPAPIEKVWAFFSSERNLERITPPFLNFTVTGKSTEEIEAGTKIDYRLKIRGVPMGWQTEIADWQPPHRFRDTQKKGPYSLWNHVHEFEQLGEGVLMRDTVLWRVPLGGVGRLAALIPVLKDVENIFRYRADVIGQIFFPH